MATRSSTGAGACVSTIPIPTIPSLFLYRPQACCTHLRIPLLQQQCGHGLLYGNFTHVAFTALATRRRKMSITPLHFSSSPQDDLLSTLDQQNAPQDMERYLNDLSLEYESVWDTKPAWCQPWTIIFTGSAIVSLSWLALHSVPISVIASLVIAAWWYIFLYSYPQAYSAMIAERRKRVSDGEEDIYGFKTSDK